MQPVTAGDARHRRLTNERRYESNDSREMEKCSISPELPLESEDDRDAVVRYLLGHALFSSVGDGGRYTPLSLTTV